MSATHAGNHAGTQTGTQAGNGRVDPPHVERREKRLPVVLLARCRTRSGFRDHGVITDLSSVGCRYESHSLSLYEGDLVVIRPDGLEGLCGRVRWVKQQTVGIAFDSPLHAAVLQHLARVHAHFLRPSTCAARTGDPSRLVA